MPEQFDPSNIDPVSRGVDKEFLEVLNVKFSVEELDKLYKLVHENLSAWIGE